MADVPSSSASKKRQTQPPQPSSPPKSPISLPSLQSPPSPPTSLNPNLSKYFDETIQNSLNFEKSTSPTQFMFYHGNNYWENFPIEITESLCSCFMEHKPMLILEIDGEKHAFDFLRMVEVKLIHGTQRSIAWVDKEGKHFFPKKFLSYDGSDDHIRPINKGKRKIRQDEELDVVTSGNVKHNYRYLGSNKQRNLPLDLIINSDPKPPKFPNTKPLKQDNMSYIYINDMFVSNIFKHDPHAIVMGVHEVKTMVPQWKACWLEFQKQAEVTRAGQGEANIVYAWYATTKEGVASILCNGFSLPPESSELPQAIKGAIYLASLDSPNYSAIQTQVENTSEEKHIILCRVLLGNVEKVHLELEQTTPSREEFNTGADYPKNPKWYVVWKEDMNKRILPMCVITCKTTAINPVKLPAHYYEDSTLSKLVLEMKQHVPLFKVRLIDNLFDALKNRKLSKSAFMKHMRTIASDHMLVTSVKQLADGK